VPRSGSTTPRFSYGPIQILDDTAAGLYSQRNLIKPHEGALRPISTNKLTNTEPSAALKSSLTVPSSGAWWIVLFLTRFEDHLGRYFDLPALVKTGLLIPLTSLTGSQQADAATIASYLNAYTRAHPLVDPVASLVRLYVGASSLAGMANSVSNKRADTQLANMLAKYPEARA
jgi:hypothetical protein